MLVLSRKENQRIRLGDDITITIVRVAGDQVRLGIDAPRTVPIVREELNLRDQPGATTTGDLPAPTASENT
ncbi:carbon storage regulator [Thermopirellula anaerolimosa]